MRAAKTAETPVRIGRPPIQLAGEVEARILDAAAKVFMARGFEGASIEAIAEAARCGKPTIYNRYPDKEALFEATFLRRLAERNNRLETHPLREGSVEDRLKHIGVALVEESLSGDFIGLMRLAIAEARRLPELVSGVVRQCRERGQETIAHLLVEGVGETFGLSEGDARARKAARIFGETVLVPFLLRALAEVNLDALREEIPDHVRERVTFFLAAVRNGGLT